MTTTKKQADGLEPTTAIHAQNQDGSAHVVGIGNLRVLLINDDGSWFAQGLEIDYFAQGDSLDDAKARFERGLEATLDEHLKVHGTISGALQVAPKEVWGEALDSAPQMQTFWQVSTHRLEPWYSGIQYFSQASAEAC